MLDMPTSSVLKGCIAAAHVPPVNVQDSALEHQGFTSGTVDVVSALKVIRDCCRG